MRSNRKNIALALGALIATVLLLYLRGINGPFLYDDITFVVENPAVKSFSLALGSFGDPAALDSGTFTYHAYRPLLPVVYAAVHALFGMTPSGFHLLNMLAHAAGVLLLFLLLLHLTKNRWAAFFASGWWAFHPAHVEAVEFISSTEDVLCGTLVIATFLLVLKNRRIPALILFCVSMLIKESTIMVIGVVFLFHIQQAKAETLAKRAKGAFWYTAPFVGIASAYVGVRILAIGMNGAGVPWGETLGIRMFTMAESFLIYLRLVFFPIHLKINYLVDIASSVNGYVAAAGLIILASFIVAIRCLKNNFNVSLGIVWFYCFLIPVANVIPFQSIMNERFLYLPLVGVAILIAVVASKISRYKPAFALLFALVIILFAAMSFWRLGVWLDEERFLLDITAKEPKIFGYQKALYHLSLKNHHDDQAEQVARQIVQNFPESMEGVNILVGLLEKQGRASEVKEILLGKARKNPSNILLCSRLAKFYLDHKNYKQALALFTLLVKKKPDNELFRKGLEQAQKAMEAASKLALP
jgi:hypothetical protein